jgi:hypothetical protein
MKKKIILICFFMLISILILPFIAEAQDSVVRGVIIKASTNNPIPGLTVSLVHSSLGRSRAAITDQFGQFEFYQIPIRNEPYYIEVYWGNSLIYRNTVLIQGPTTIPPIKL